MDEDDIDFEDVENFNLGPLSVEQELVKFRREWKAEITDLKNKTSDHTSDGANGNIGKPRMVNDVEGPSVEEQAKFLFLQGVSAEQSSRYFEAIQFYRRAVQLVPDIEFKVYEHKLKPQRKVRTISECSVDSTGSALGEEDPDDLEDLLSYFHKMKITENGLCVPMFDSMSVHISALPMEVLNYIFKWVVSSELDIVSLEHLSEVSRGFYVCARDEELWRLICQRVWGRNCGDATNYGSFRNMYYQRPHLRFNGCYISKSCYYRHGEKSLDSFYRPYSLVEYYRYVKFYPDGQMLMLTTPDNPYEVLPKLQFTWSRMQGVTRGYYRLTGDVITAVLKRKKNEHKSPYERFRRKNRNDNTPEQSFHVEFELSSSGKRKHSQLNWRYYSFNTLDKQTSEETVAEFELNNKTYPALIFSRVKSYTATTDNPLK